VGGGIKVEAIGDRNSMQDCGRRQIGRLHRRADCHRHLERNAARPPESNSVSREQGVVNFLGFARVGVDLFTNDA
jgi:hypothetical protein